LLTHEFIDQESTLFSDDGLARHTTRKTKNSPYQYGIGKDGDVHSGAELWEEFVSKYSNFEFVFNGHYKPFAFEEENSEKLEWVRDLAVSYRSDSYDDGRKVHQMLLNGQWAPRGGEGWFRLIEFLADGETVRVWTVSSHLEKKENGGEIAWPNTPDRRFTLKLPKPMAEEE
jgi:hypothetical protein